MRKKLS